MFTRVRASLLLWNLLIMSVILLAAGSVTYVSQRRSLMSELDRLLSQTIKVPSATTSSGGQDTPWFEQSSPFTLIVDYSGHVLADPQGLGVKDILRLRVAPVVRQDNGYVWRNFAYVNNGATQGQQVRLLMQPEQTAIQTISTTVIDGQPVRLLTQPVALIPPDAAGQSGTAVPPTGDVTVSPNALLITGVSLVPTENALHKTLIFLLIGGAAGLLLALLGSWFLAGRALIPIQTAFRRQQEFVADAAHELRTPLTVLQTSAHLLHQHRGEPLDAQGRVFDDLREDIGRLTRLAGDLLDLARSDLHQLDLMLGRVDLQELGQMMVRRLSAVAAEREIDLRFEGSGQPIVVDADSDRLQQVLMALLDNALKHTAPWGTVTLAVSESGSGVAIEVRDTGEGIPPEALGRIFDRFYRGDRARSRTTGGAGLGLAIAKMLIEAHGGTLTLSSVLGSGTVATIRLPLTTEAPAIGRWPRARRRFPRISRPA